MTQKVPDVAGAEAGCGIPMDLPAWAEAQADAHRRERRDAIENRRRVLATARTLIAERGVDAVSMHDIARFAGIGQGTLYRRYPHKGALCHALLEDSMMALYQDVSAHLQARPAGESVLAQIAYLLTRLLAFTEANAPLLSAMQDAACGERRTDTYHHPMRVWLHQTLVVLLARAAAEGETPALDVECVADILLALCDPDLFLYQRTERGFSRERIASTLRQIVGGLRVAEGLPEAGEAVGA